MFAISIQFSLMGLLADLLVRNLPRVSGQGDSCSSGEDRLLIVDKAKIEKILESFEGALKRPMMYFGRVDDPWLARNFLYGIDHAVSICYELKPRLLTDLEYQVLEQRGLRISPEGSVKVLREKHLNDEEIVIELVRIHIDIYNALLSEIV